MSEASTTGSIFIYATLATEFVSGPQSSIQSEATKHTIFERTMALNTEPRPCF